MNSSVILVIIGLITAIESNQQQQLCGTLASNYIPCIESVQANQIFSSCCEQFVDRECQHLCRYETRDIIARKEMITAVHSDGCSLRNIAPILYCASQNHDNRDCCAHLQLNSTQLNVNNRCMRMCNPNNIDNIIGTLIDEDLVCIGNWNVIMFCHQSGLRL